MTDLAPAETSTPETGDGWSIGDMTRGASERLAAINEQIDLLRKQRASCNAQIKALTVERVKIERLMRAVEREPKPRATTTKRGRKETTDGEA